ncbi:MAG TPA: c-type cytochrome domain-containing protein, partial [Pirellulales bacterium]
TPAATDATANPAATVVPAAAPEPVPAEKISFHKQVRPILLAHCQGCHQPAKPLGEYVLTNFTAMMKGGESGAPAIVPGKPDESPFVQQITPPKPGDAAEMPKGKDPLHETQIATIRHWISQGAIDDTPPDSGPKFDAEHPPVYRSAPTVSALAYSPDGSLIAIGGLFEVVLHKADGTGVAARLIGQSERITSVAFSPDGKLLAATGGCPCRFGEVQIWDVASKTLKTSVQITFDDLYGASWSHDGTRVAFGCADKSVRAIEAETGKQVLFQGAHNDWVLGTVWSIDASHLVSVSRDMSMKLIEVGTQRFVDNITSITPGALKGGLLSVDRHPTRDELLVGGSDGQPKIYKMYRTEARKIGDDFNKLKEFSTLPGRVFTVRYSKDGSKIVCGSSFEGRGSIRVYEADSTKPICDAEGPIGGVFAAAFSPDATRFAATGFDGMVRVYDAATGKKLVEFPAAPTAPVAPQ